MDKVETFEQLKQSVVENSLRWFPEAYKKGIDLNLTVLGIAGEAGECADVLKKYLRGSMPQEEFQRRLVEETIDVLHYLTMIWVAFQIDVGDVYAWKTEINEKRFGKKLQLPNPNGQSEG